MAADFDPSLLLETLWLGVVPDRGASAYTVGRDDVLKIVEDDLQACGEGDGVSRCWLGGYGTGKTHMLELVEQRALADNFLVASAVLDPVETAPSHPRRVYSALTRSLRYPDLDASVAGLEPLLRRAIDQSTAMEQFGVDATGITTFDPAMGQHLYLTTALRWFRALQSTRDDGAVDVLLQWIEGQPSGLTADINDRLKAATSNQGHLYSLKDFRPWSRIYGYLLSGVASLARAVGYSGVVVMLDEAEFYTLLSADDQSYAQTLFQALSFAASGPSSDLPFVADELDHGGSGVLRELPPQYGERAGLYVSFAMTPHAAGLDALRQAIPADAIVELPTLENSDYDELVRRVLQVFEVARPDAELPTGLVDPLGKVVRGLLRTGLVENPRQAIKFLVQFLDTADRMPDRLPVVFGALRDQLPLA